MKLFCVLHHSADPFQGPQFEKVNASHKARGFPMSSLGFHVGYHYFCGVDGTIKQARIEGEVGAHCDAKLMNYVGIGICLAGDFTQHDPTPEQIDSLVRLVEGIQQRWPIPDEAILLHRECKPTACPGKDLRQLLLKRRSQSSVVERKWLDRLQEGVARRLARRLRQM